MRRPSPIQDTTTIGCYAYAAAGLVAVVLHPGLFSFLGLPDSDVTGAVTFVLTLAFLVGCLGGAVGVVKRRWWGFVSLYIATLIGAFGLGLCMVPFAITVFPTQSPTVLLLTLNSAFLIGLALLQFSVFQQDRAGG